MLQNAGFGTIPWEGGGGGGSEPRTGIIHTMDMCMYMYMYIHVYMHIFYLGPPFGCQISAPNGLFLVGFLGRKFQTRLEDSGMYILD